MESPKPGPAGPLQHNDYTVGWVCALPKEQTAATAMLDERHKDRELHLKRKRNDINTYTLGSIGRHNIVIACLPKGKFGTISAATVAAHMVNSFPAIRFGLMVGIGGAVSRKVRLGDVVVSTPSGTHPGVVQWDMGKAGDHFERTGSLNNPPNMLLTALTKLETDHDTEGSKVPDYLKAVCDNNTRLREKYEKSQLVDRLFKASYDHVSESHGIEDDEIEDDDDDGGCQHCDPAETVKRKPRDMIMVHYGTIASGNQVIKNAKLRDQLSKDLGGNILCVEMEAAGLMDNFPCIVIRGICDYTDSHKNDAWQEHAAAVAAAFAKEYLGYIQASEVEGERTVQETLHTGR
ncbi:purine and uridine phosphorylase [Apiospora sp. TS-2023a]